MGDGIEIIPLSAIEPDSRNANRHTERGTYMLNKSMEKFGFLEPGVLDASNNVIGGNNRLLAAADVLDPDGAIVIDIDGTKPVFVRRKDLSLDTPQGREAAIALNRTAQVGIEFDADVIGADIGAGVDLGDWFQPFELEALMGQAPPDDWREYDESAADDVEFNECPNCGHKWPK
jgi:hypothetical protein